MKPYTKRRSVASSQTQKSKPNPLEELRGARSSLSQSAIRLEYASLGVTSAFHARHLATLSRLAREAAQPISVLIHRLELEAASV